VAVRRDRRGRGLGTALLHQAFGELYRRGQRRVGLVVDSWNTTGAKQLYEKVGMRTTLEHLKFEKALSP
jgi:mycothiol synthase